MSLALFYGLGIAGWLLFKKIKIPAPAILGSLVFLGAAGVFGITFTLPPLLRPILSVILGIILGLRFNLKNKGILKEILLVSLWLSGLTVLAALALSALKVDPVTALFAATPGGLTEMTLVSMSFKTDPFAVALLQMSRMMLTVILIPFLSRMVKGKLPRPGIGDTANTEKHRSRPLIKIDWVVLAILSVLSAWLLGMIHVPASNMIGPMLTVGAYTYIRRLKARINGIFQNIVQVGVGGMVGLTVTRESILSLPSYILPIVCLNIIIVGGCFILAYILCKISRWDMTTCLIATAPGGLSPMILLAIEMGADADRVVVFQVLRMVLVLLLTPMIGRLII
ncbi:MAG: AbrB family transcriptional regulator [Treponema sp.]|nr:AbrB family transcriptional regulator [Treponema sp.]